jgi:hypothetical protein
MDFVSHIPNGAVHQFGYVGGGKDRRVLIFDLFDDLGP